MRTIYAYYTVYNYRSKYKIAITFMLGTILTEWLQFYTQIEKRDSSIFGRTFTHVRLDHTALLPYTSLIHLHSHCNSEHNYLLKPSLNYL